jgi:hypothetical protein
MNPVRKAMIGMAVGFSLACSSTVCASAAGVLDHGTCEQEIAMKRLLSTKGGPR